MNLGMTKFIKKLKILFKYTIIKNIKNHRIYLNK